MRSKTTHLTRLALIAAVPAVLLGAVLLGQPAGADSPTATTMPMPVTTMDMGGSDGLPAGDWTPTQRSYLLDLIAETEADLPAFSDPAYLESIGFHNFGIAAPGGYVHYINNAWINDDHILDPNYPESLLFQRTYDSGTGESIMTLKAAMFFLPQGTTMDTIPPDLAWFPGWHVHPSICVTDDAKFAGLANSDGTCSSGHPMSGPPMTHVWIADNACGHRFGMVDIGGLMCDMHMHMPGGDGGPTTTMHMPMPTDPGAPADTIDMSMDPDQSTTTTPDVLPSEAKPAEPIDAQPAYAG